MTASFRSVVFLQFVVIFSSHSTLRLMVNLRIGLHIQAVFSAKWKRKYNLWSKLLMKHAYPFIGAFTAKDCRCVPLSFAVYVSVCPPTCNNLRTAERIFMKFYVGEFTKICWHVMNLVTITGILYEGLHVFLLESNWTRIRGLPWLSWVPLTTTVNLVTWGVLVWGIPSQP